VLEQQRHRVPCLERHASRQHLVAEHSGGVDIAPAVELTFTDRLLRRHVRRRANRDSGRCQARAGFHGPRDPEVGDHHATGLTIKQDVVRLDVPVDDAAQVGVGERVRDLRQNAAHFVDRLSRLAHQVRGEASAGHHRHHEVGNAVTLADVVDGHDVRVRQLGRRLGFAGEAGPDGAVVGELGRQNLDCHRSIQPQIARAEHDRHATPPNLVFQLVGLTDGGNHAVVQGLGHSILQGIVSGRAKGTRADRTDSGQVRIPPPHQHVILVGFKNKETQIDADRPLTRADAD